MRILLIPEYGTFGGTRTYFKSLLKYYYDQNHEVYILLNKKQDDSEIKSLVNNYNFFIMRRIDFIFGYKLFGRKLGLIIDNVVRALFLIVVKIIVRPLLVVYSQGEVKKDILQLMLNKKYIYIVHSYPTGQLNVLIRYMLSKTLGPRRIFLTVSKYAKDSIIKHWVLNNKRKYIYYIYNYVNRPHIYIGNKLDRNTILTIGHVVDYKNPILWIDVAKTINRQNKVKFIWAGDGPLLDVCKSRIGEYDSELIQFIGFKHDIGLLYRDATIYFQPSLLESHGISVIEAMAYGIPCIVSNVGGLPESVHDGVNGYVVDVTDKAAMVEKIEILLSDDKLRSKFGEESVKMINNKFSKAIWYKKMNNLHAKILCIR